MRTTKLLCGLLTVAASTAFGAPLAAQTLEGSKWSIEQEGVDAPVLWWLGSQGRVRTDVGTILAGHKWRQAGDSLFVTIGDTVKYAGMLMSNRLVGIRTASGGREGWWSGARADGPDAVAAAAVAPATETEQMNRPVDAPAQITPAGGAPAGAPTGAAAAPRTLQRIEREGAASPPAAGTQGGGREIRRIERANALAPTPPVPLETLVGLWIPADTGGVITSLDLKADGSGSVSLTNGNRGRVEWSNESEGTRLSIGNGERAAVMRAWMEGSTLNIVVLTANGPRRTWHFRRQGRSQ